MEVLWLCVWLHCEIFSFSTTG